MAQEKFIRTRDSNPGRLASPKKQEFQLLKCFGVISRSDWSIFCFEAEFRLQHGHHDMTFFVSCFSDRLTLVTDFFSKRIVIECDTSMSTTTTTMTTTRTTTKMTATRKCRFSDKKKLFCRFLVFISWVLLLTSAENGQNKENVSSLSGTMDRVIASNLSNLGSNLFEDGKDL